MLRRALLVVLMALGFLAVATPAHAEANCYTPNVAGFDTFQVCMFLPELSD